MEHELTRRDWLGLAGAATAGVWAADARGEAAQTPPKSPRPADEPFGYCLNSSTVRGHNLPITRTAELAAAAGYHGLEPWIRELDEHVKAGGTLRDLRKKFADLGLEIPSVIGFFDWVVDDPARRKKGLEEARRNFAMVRDIGGLRLAAPPVGATDRTDIDLKRAAERYRELLELGDQFGVVAEVEVWGFSKTLGQLGEAAQVAIGSGHPKACILADVYHLYKGGSAFRGVTLLGKDAIPVFHMNDYPADPPRDRINDADRVYPGDGVAPLGQLFRDLNAIGFRGMLSVELFNKAYYGRPAEEVVKTAIEKLRKVVKSSLA